MKKLCVAVRGNFKGSRVSSNCQWGAEEVGVGGGCGERRRIGGWWW